MVRLLVLVEGQTEETFVEELLAPHLQPYGVYATAKVLETKPGFKGGLVNYDHVTRDLEQLLLEDKRAFVTTMFDLYRLPTNFPGYASAQGQGIVKAGYIENAFLEDI